MTSHPHLERGMTILHTRLGSPLHPGTSFHAPPTRPFITISREACAGATTLANELLPLLDAEFKSEERSWMLLDKDLIQRALTRHALPERLAEFLPEDRVSEVQALIGELIGLHPPLWQLEQKISEAILQIAQRGHVILAGRGAHLVTQFLAGGLHLRLIAPRAARIRRLQETAHVTAEEAARTLDRLDHARERFVRSTYEEDIADPHGYDLVINTERIRPPEAAQLILQAIRGHLPARPPP